MSENGTVEPAVFGSADGVTWQTMTALTALAGSDAQFLGVAAGPGGYLVVGKQGTGSQASVALWWSADLKNWVNGETSGPPGSFAAAAVAVDDGFVAVGSENNCHTIWTSADGQHWTAQDLAKPSGCDHRDPALGRGRRRAAASWRRASPPPAPATSPIVVTSADDGAHVTQVVLSAPDGPATVTAVTATSDGFVAVGLAGPAGAQHAVTWTSPDGLTWSPADPAPGGGHQRDHGPDRHGTAGTHRQSPATAQRGTTPALLTLPAP